MAVRKTIRQVASYYRKSARFAAFIILLASFAIPSVLASGPGSLNLSPDVSVNAVTPFGCGNPFFPSNGYYQASGGVGITGTYSGNVFLTGSITIYGHDKATDKPETQTLTLTQADFSPNPMNFPSQSQSGVNNPQVNSNFCEPVVDGYTYWVAAANQPGCTGGGCLLANSSVTVTVTGGTTQMFQLVMEMPLFNETTLGTTVHCAPTTAPCGLPLQGFYDFIFIIAIILAGGGLLIALANKQYTGDERKNVVLDFVMAVLFIVLFPVIYNNIALLINYLDMTILAGPGLPYTDYTLSVSLVWGKLLSWAQGGGIWGLLVSPITTLAGAIVALIVYLMTIFLGVIRIWLITVMVIGFPISLALKQIPFARKLSSMVEDTLYGLMLASLMSSIAIGVAAYVLADAPGGPVWSATIFAGYRDKRNLELGCCVGTLHRSLDSHRLRTAHRDHLPDCFAGGDGRGRGGYFDGGSRRGASRRCGRRRSWRGGWSRRDECAGQPWQRGVWRCGRGDSDYRPGSGKHNAEHGARRETALRSSPFTEEHGRRGDNWSSFRDGSQ